MLLETERKYFDSIKKDLLEKASGKYAVIVGDELLGTFDHRHDGYAEAVKRFGNVPMLIKRIQEADGVEEVPALMLGLL